MTKNAASRIAPTIHSVQAQSFRDYEHWIIDGLSDDDIRKKIKKLKASIKDSKLKFISEKDQGIYDAMNKGARLAKGDYLLFLNAGDHLYAREAIRNIFKDIHSKTNGKTISKRNDKKSSAKLSLSDLIVANIQTLDKLGNMDALNKIDKLDKMAELGELAKIAKVDGINNKAKLNKAKQRKKPDLAAYTAHKTSSYLSDTATLWCFYKKRFFPSLWRL